MDEVTKYALCFPSHAKKSRNKENGNTHWADVKHPPTNFQVLGLLTHC